MCVFVLKIGVVDQRERRYVGNGRKRGGCWVMLAKMKERKVMTLTFSNG